MNEQNNDNRDRNAENKEPLPNQTQSGQNSVGVSWEFEPAEDAGHRLNLIFNLLLNNKIG